MVLLHDLRRAGVGDGHYLVKCLPGLGVELLLLLDGPHMVDVVVGRIRPHVAEVVNSWQLDLAQDPKLADDFPSRNLIFALAHARPALPLC